MESNNSVQVSPSSLQCPGTPTHRELRAAGQDGFPASPRGWRRAEGEREPGAESGVPEGGSVLLLRELQLLWMALPGSACCQICPCGDMVMNKGASSLNPAHRVLLHGKNGWTGSWEETSLVQHHSAVPGNKETEVRFCEGHFSFVRAQGEGELLN